MHGNKLLKLYINIANYINIALNSIFKSQTVILLMRLIKTWKCMPLQLGGIRKTFKVKSGNWKCQDNLK